MQVKKAIMCVVSLLLSINVVYVHSTLLRYLFILLFIKIDRQIKSERDFLFRVWVGNLPFLHCLFLFFSQTLANLSDASSSEFFGRNTERTVLSLELEKTFLVFCLVNGLFN